MNSPLWHASFTSEPLSILPSAGKKKPFLSVLISLGLPSNCINSFLILRNIATGEYLKIESEVRQTILNSLISLKNRVSLIPNGNTFSVKSLLKIQPCDGVNFPQAFRLKSSYWHKHLMADPISYSLEGTKLITFRTGGWLQCQATNKKEEMTFHWLPDGTIQLFSTGAQNGPPLCATNDQQRQVGFPCQTGPNYVSIKFEFCFCTWKLGKSSIVSYYLTL